MNLQKTYLDKLALKEWEVGIDGHTKKEIQDILIKNGFDPKKIKRQSEDALSVIWDIAKRQGKIKIK